MFLGCLEPSSEISFVHEIERFSVDPVPWVRRETSFAIGALAKSVPDEVVHMSLVCTFAEQRNLFLRPDGK